MGRNPKINTDFFFIYKYILLAHNYELLLSTTRYISNSKIVIFLTITGMNITIVRYIQYVYSLIQFICFILGQIPDGHPKNIGQLLNAFIFVYNLYITRYSQIDVI